MKLLPTTNFVLGIWSQHIAVFEFLTIRDIEVLRKVYTHYGITPNAGLALYTRDEWENGFNPASPEMKKL